MAHGNGPHHGATEVTLTSAQCRAGRGLIDWSRDQLARQAGIAVRTVMHFERGARGPRPATEDALRRALEAGGVIFVEEDGEGVGVRLRKNRSVEGLRPEELNASNDD